MQSPPPWARHALKRRPLVALGQCGQICARWASLLAVLLVLAVPAGALRAEDADLELVFAVDASGSVDPAEYRLQLAGIAAALTDAEVLQAISRGKTGRIAVNLLVWAQSNYPKDETGWFVISTPAEAARFASLVADFRRGQSGGTGLGDGIAKSVTSIVENGIAATRMVIDVSGDGPETPPRDHTVLLPQSRMMANYHGITVNGLAILNDDPTLDNYYRTQVITGPGSFVEVARDYADFARAMKKKLLREVQPEPVVGMR